jgi:diguanylate cyclase (GGDEF)-like protein/PAS domain S-box-containing protein
MSAPLDQAALLQALAENVPAAFAYYDADVRCVFANQGYAAIFGLDLNTIKGMHVREIAGEAVYEFITPYINEVYAARKARYERNVTLPSGEKRIHEISLWPHLDAAGKVIGVFLQSNDISSFRAQETALRHSEERLGAFAVATREGLYFHAAGVVTDVNPALLELIGYTLDEVVGKPVVEFVPPDHRAQLRERAMREEPEPGPFNAEMMHKDGTRIPVEVVARNIVRNGVPMRFGAVRDIRERLKAQAQLQHMANHDPLTGLSNRAHWFSGLETLANVARRKGTQLAVLFMDLDHFKPVNDTLGHHAGDALLVDIAKRLKAAVRESDLVGRMGGDEFVVALNEVEGVQGALQAAQKISSAATLTVALGSGAGEVTVTPSIGVALFPTHADDAESLVREADGAMYVAKASGRNQAQVAGEARNTIGSAEGLGRSY